MRSNKIKIGDKVAVIDDTINGIVTSVTEESIQLEDENGFLYHYAIGEVVLVKEDLYANIKFIPKRKEIKPVKKKVVKSKKQTVLEVDLHIHQITHSDKYLSNSVMLQRQISHAKAKLDYAVKHHIQKVVFIHGKGQGVLKTELMQLLKKYSVEINDASYQKYGKGATEVYIFKSKI